MKKQLRNIAFAAAVLASATAVAQDAPQVLEPAWTQAVPCSAAGNVRFGMGFQEKVYFQDKGTHAIVVADGTSYENYVQDDRLCGTGITIDAAGNIVATTVFPDAASSYKYLLIDTEKNITEIDAESEIETPGRVDFLGRAIGNFMSEEGGVFFIAPGSQSKIYGISIVSGELNYDQFGFASSSVEFAGGELDNSACAVPRFETMEEMYQAVEDGIIESASNAFYCREKRGLKTVVEVEMVDGVSTIVPWITVPDNFTTYGFDAFELQGKKYVVVNYGTSHTQNFQVYCVTDNQRVAISNLPEKVGPSAQLSFNIEKVSDTKVNIYAVVYEGTNVHCSCTPFEVEETPVVENNVYWDNTNTEWDNVYAYIWVDGGDPYAAWPGTLLSDPVENIYTYAVPEGGYNKIIFNNGAGAQTADLDLEIGKIYEGEKPVPGTADIYLIGNIKGHDWDTAYTGAGLEKIGEGIYQIKEIELGNGGADSYFAFITKTGASWDVVNSGTRYGAEGENTPIAVGQTLTVQENWNSWKIASGIYTFTLNINEMTLNVTDPSGISSIAADNAPAVYYNLQGVKVDNPENGLYIVKRGNKVTKEMVK
ncbi:MAG: starch-binding protein [Muribaculaceae bacterium]|nr:starch-binding protein [Muribaculaceae bacterium]